LSNSSGIQPTEYKVLIDPKPVEEKSRGGIIIPDMTKESEKYAQIEGRIVAVSHLAFTYATPDEWVDKKPKPGDAVLYAKYAGVRVKGKDGKEYVLVNDKDIAALIEESA
jgi:chaperonin GroES